MCLGEPVFDGHMQVCPSCDAWWTADGCTGGWLEPDAPACDSVCRPYEQALDTARPLGGAISVTPLAWRCGLARGHDEWHRTLRLPGLEWGDDGHAHTFMPGLPPIDCTTGEPCHCDVPAHL